MTGDKLLEIEDLHVSVEGRAVLKGVSLSVGEGEIHALFGPNGSGKTTLLNTVIGFSRYKITRGAIYFKGRDITGATIDERARLGVGISFQRPPTIKGVTLRSLISFGSPNLSREEIEKTAAKLDAEEFLDREINAGLSGGEMKRLEIATVLAKPHKVSIFDEPEAGIDLWSFSMLIKRFEEIHKEKKECLILISHQERIIQMADKIMVIEDGQVKEYGTKEDVLPTLFQQKTGRMCGQEGGTC